MFGSYKPHWIYSLEKSNERTLEKEVDLHEKKIYSLHGYGEGKVRKNIFGV